jgi:hypothetical protein
MRRVRNTIPIFLVLLMSTAVHSADLLSVPEVRLRTDAVSFQESVYPDWYRTNSAAADIRWVARNDSLLQTVWASQGDSILAKLSQLAGLNWVEKSFPIYLLRYYPSAGEADPLVVPIGGQLRGLAIEAPPSGSAMIFNLIYWLSQRMLVQTEISGTDAPGSVTNHPLMDPGNFRRDNLAMLLTMAVAPSFVGAEATLAAYNSPFWKACTPGRLVFEEQFQKKWILTIQRPLAQWLKDEPYDSPLVDLTRAPQITADSDTDQPVTVVAGIPVKGTLGFTVKSSSSAKYEIDKLDPSRLGGLCGLKIGDAISQIDGRRPGNVRELYERILSGLERGASTVTLFRSGKLTTVVLRRK